MMTIKKIWAWIIIFTIFLSSYSAFGISGNENIGGMVRRVFIDFLDATEPQLPTCEKKQRISQAIFNHRGIMTELFFRSNRQLWEDANLKIAYDKVRGQFKLGPLLSLLYQGKEGADLNPILNEFNQMTFNLVPTVSKVILQYIPFPPPPFGLGVANLPVVSNATDHEIEVLASAINDSIVSFRLNDSQFVEELFSPPNGFDLGQLPEDAGDKVVEALQEFINQFPLERKRKMARALLQLPPNASLAKMVAATSVHAGPLFVKLMQLLQIYSPVDMQNELKILLDGMPPHLNEEEVKNILEENVPEDIRKRIIYFNYKPLSVASLGQVHHMVLERSDGEVVKAVVKLIAPKFEQMTQDDLVNFERAMGNFKFGKKMVASVKMVMDEELNLETEAAYTEEGVKLYRDLNQGIDVPDVLRLPDFPVTPGLLAQTFALGRTLNRITDQVIAESGLSETQFNIYLSKALIAYLKKWFRHAIFERSRLAHADSHKGNIFFNIEKKTRTQKKPYRLTVIDFGSMARMSREEAEAVVLLGQGLFLSQTSDIIDGFYHLTKIANGGDVDSVEVEKLEKLRVFIESGKENYVSMHNWFTHIAMEALRLQIELPTSFLQFNRGRTFIENLVEDSLLKLKNSPDPRAQREYEKLMGSFEAYMATTFRVLMKDLGQKISTLGRVDSVVSVPTIAIGSTKKCVHILSTCFTEGPRAALMKEVYPVIKNVYDLSSAVHKDMVAHEFESADQE